jgi:glycosyltransferase involved in cell wall biosynthesis
LKLEEKLVSVVTPVYNGAPYLRECIQSVARQTHENFEYFIVDNCSTDGSFEIAQEEAASDNRITAIRHAEHVGPIQNWNRSLTTVSQESDYVKFVHADDWLFPDCLARMIGVAESDQKVGIVSAYRLEEDKVSLDRLPMAAPRLPGEDTFIMDGREVARAILMEKASVLGSPTSIMFRSDLLRGGDPFFAEVYLHADKEACLRLLQNCDFGFVRQVLTFTRRHNESVTSLTNRLDTRRQENLLMLKELGPGVLSAAEYRSEISMELNAYYRFLARYFGTGMGQEFWDSHRQNLGKAGFPFSASKLAGAVVRKWLNPASALKDHLHDKSSRNTEVDTKAKQFLASSRAERSQKDR